MLVQARISVVNGVFDPVDKSKDSFNSRTEIWNRNVSKADFKKWDL